MIKHMKFGSYLANTLIAVVLAAALSACGFHLRGNIPLPDGIKNMYLLAPKGSFKEQLEDVLPNGGAILASSRAGGDVVLNIKQATTERTVGTLDERGKVDSYNIVFRVQYVLEDPQGKQIRTASLNDSRRYNFDPELVLESESEEADLLEDMERDIALRIVRQLASVTDYPPSEGTKATKGTQDGAQSADSTADDGDEGSAEEESDN
ncbi:MAG: LPS assembly lipoprotein LptE [Pseudomonadota bacterium]